MCGEGKKVVGWVEVEVVFAKIAEYPRGIILEFEVISRRGCQLVADTLQSFTVSGPHIGQVCHLHVKGEFVAGGKVVISQRPLDLGLGPRYSNADAGKHVVHQHIVDMTLADQVSD